MFAYITEPIVFSILKHIPFKSLLIVSARIDVTVIRAEKNDIKEHTVLTGRHVKQIGSYRLVALTFALFI